MRLNICISSLSKGNSLNMALTFEPIVIFVTQSYLRFSRDGSFSKNCLEKISWSFGGVV